MLRNGLHHNRPYRKCANVVGEVLGKYHPHGDLSVYDALVRMAQPWNLRYLLIDGQGNFGSVDGDNPAAYRYTECRMTALGEELLGDIDKETVDFQPNFDGKLEEPIVLPAAFPNLLVNGSEGIAVGMATKIPPHNLTEVIDGLLALIENPELSIMELMKFIPAPDFPTAGMILGRDGVKEAYETGRGKVIMRGMTEFEEVDGREAIIITELPFQVNKARLQEEIAELVKDKRLDGIHAVRDESNRKGMRVVIELKRDAIREIVQNHLFKQTQLQTTFGIIMLAIVQQRPRVLTLKEMLQYYLGHRREVTLRRIRYELRKLKDRAHILEGLRIALDNIDAVIALIRASRTTDEARMGLCVNFGLSEIQAQAILDMRLQRLTGLEREKLEEEYTAVQAEISRLSELLSDDTKFWALVRAELVEVREKYGDVRRTRIIEERTNLSSLDFIADEDQIVTLSHRGYIKRTSMDEYRMQKRGGLGRTGMATRDEDFVVDLFVANTHSYLLIFTNTGYMYWLRVADVPEASPTSKGKPIVNLVQLETGEKVASVVNVRDFEAETDLVFCSRNGLVKRTVLSAYGNIRGRGLTACDVVEGDELLSVKLAGRDRELLITTKAGMSIRFEGEDVRPMGRVSRGVRGIDLVDDDVIVDIEALPHDAVGYLLTATSRGYGKRTLLEQYRLQGRAGRGVIDIQTDERNGDVVGGVIVGDDDQVMLITDTGRVIRMRASDIRVVGRNTKGVRLMRLEEGERIVAIARVEDTGEEPGEVAAPVDGAEVESVTEGVADDVPDGADDGSAGGGSEPEES